MMKIGLVGCGTIGRVIAQAIDQGKIKARLVAVFDLDENKSKNLVESLKDKPAISSLKKLIDLSDLVLEAASVKAVKEIAQLVFEKNKALFLMSTGGLLIYPEIIDLAQKSEGKRETGAV